VQKVLRLAKGPGVPFTREEALADRERIVRLLRTRGRPYPTIEPPDLHWNQAHTRVSILWVVDPGKEVCFGPTLIRGNYLTRESIIRRDLPFRPGDPFNENLLLEARQNLEQRQIFTFVRVTANPGENAQFLREAREAGWTLSRNPVPVLVEVGERYDNSGEVQLFLGVAADNVVGFGNPFYGQASYIWRNVWGTGIEFEARGELSSRVQTLLGRLAVPRVFGPLWRLDMSGSWKKEFIPALGQITSYGGRAELRRDFSDVDEQGRRLPPSLSIYTRLDIAISQLFVPLYRSEGISDFSVLPDQTQELKLIAGVLWDRRVGFDAPTRRLRGEPPRPNPLMPVSGFLMSAEATIALCCSTFTAPPSFSVQGSFAVLTGQISSLSPFGPQLKPEDGWFFGMRRFNLKTRLYLNYGIPFARPALPVVERFYAGGDTTVRGYYPFLLKAEVIRAPLGPLDGEPAYRIVAQGGNIRFLSTLEWEFAITPRFLGLPWPWVGALFVDAGAVFNNWTGLTWNDVRFGVGVTLLRVLTQFGPLSIEYAYPLTLPGQDPLLQNDRWKGENWFLHWPGRVHFNWAIPLTL
jgi:outer membrane protein assembly factor BamA